MISHLPTIHQKPLKTVARTVGTIIALLFLIGMMFSGNNHRDYGFGFDRITFCLIGMISGMIGIWLFEIRYIAWRPYILVLIAVLFALLVIMCVEFFLPPMPFNEKGAYLSPDYMLNIGAGMLGAWLFAWHVVYELRTQN